MNINNVIIGGNLTRDIELGTAGTTSVGKFGIALNKVRKDGKTETTFVDIVTFGKTATVAAQYLHKGDEATIEGELRFENWEKDGQKHSKLLVKANRIHFGRKKDAPANPVIPEADPNEKTPF